MIEFDCFMEEQIVINNGDGGDSKVDKLNRAQVTNVLDYDHEDNSVPYFYGIYGDMNDNHTEKQGLIKGSMGYKTSDMIEVETNLNNKDLLEKGIVPNHDYIDFHSVAIKDRNASIPVGIMQGPPKYLDENGNFVPAEGFEDKEYLWYGAAVPVSFMWETHERALEYAKYQKELAIKYADNLFANAGAGGIVDQTFNRQSQNAQSGYAIYQYYGPQLSNLQQEISNTIVAFDHVIGLRLCDGSARWDGGAYQKSEKNDSAVDLKFTEVLDENAKSTYAKTYDRTAETGVNAISLGSSIATGKRSFAAGSSNIAAAEKAFATGCDNIVAGKQSFASGYANYVESSSSAVFGQQSVVKGPSSFAAGLFCNALGRFTTVFGNSNIAANPNQFVIGKFNNNKTDTVFEVGCGADDNNRANLFEVGYKWNNIENSKEALIRIGDIELTQSQFSKLVELAKTL